MFDSATRSKLASMSLSIVLALGGCTTPYRGAAAPAPALQPVKTTQSVGGEPPIKVTGTELQLSGPIFFETGSDVLQAESDAFLEPVMIYLEMTPEVTLLRIEGHTDEQGDAFSNQLLSERRALSVARWLVAQGVNCRRLLPVGFGGTRPLAPGDNPKNKSRNRRMAFVNAAINNRPIGGRPVDGGGTIAGDPCH